VHVGFRIGEVSMSVSRILRLASLLALLQYIAHSALFLTAKPTHGPDEIAVIDAMKSHHFAFDGSSRSYWDFYFGYGLLAILSGAIEIVLLWQLASLAETDPRRIRPLVLLFICANVAHAILTSQYFFLVPGLADTVVAVCLGWAFVAARRPASSQPAAAHDPRAR
jgi:hypothetical protein